MAPMFFELTGVQRSPNALRSFYTVHWKELGTATSNSSLFWPIFRNFSRGSQLYTTPHAS